MSRILPIFLCTLFVLSFAVEAYAAVSSPTRSRIILFDEVVISERFDVVFALFGRVTLCDGVMPGEVVTLSSVVIYPSDADVKISSLLGIYSRTMTGEDFDEFSDVLPAFAVRMGISVLAAAAGLVWIGAARGFSEQGSVLLVREPLSVIRNGVAVYFLFAALTVVFILTVALLPVAALFALIYFAALSLGLASLAMLAGYTVMSRLGRPASSVACACAGLLAVVVISCVPYLGFFTGILFLPMTASGIVVSGVVNAGIKKVYYETPYNLTEKKRRDGKTLRSKILDHTR